MISPLKPHSHWIFNCHSWLPKSIQIDFFFYYPNPRTPGFIRIESYRSWSLYIPLCIVRCCLFLDISTTIYIPRSNVDHSIVALIPHYDDPSHSWLYIYIPLLPASIKVSHLWPVLCGTAPSLAGSQNKASQNDLKNHLDLTSTFDSQKQD